MVLYLISIGYVIFTQRFFFADGAHYFLKILEEKKFIYADDFARHYAHYATQFIVVILIKMFNVTNLDILSFAFGLGLYFPQLVSLLLCYLIARRHDIRFLLFPIIALFGILINISFMIVHEANVIANIFWPILFYLVLQKEYRWYDVIALLFLAVIFTRCYESAAIFGTLLIVLTVAILVEQWHVSSSKTKIVRVILLTIFIVSVLIAMKSILYPRCPDNKAAFLSSFSSIFRHWPALLSFVYILALALCMILPNFVKSSLFKFVAILLVGFTLFVCFIPVLKPDLTRPSLDYDARVYMTYMLPLFAILAALVLRGNITVPSFTWEKIVILVAVLVVGQITWQILATSQWAGFREIFKGELVKHNVGVIRFEDTILRNERMGMQLIRPMTWPWSNPTLSILWSDDKNVKTVIVNPPVSWEPFNPLDGSALPRVEEYGFSFKKYKDALE